eukprot:8220705-Pyramimonas_sp.AAC.1
MRSVGNVADKFAKVLTGPAKWAGSMFGNKPTQKELDEKAAELIAGAIQGGLHTVGHHHDA